MAGTKHVRRSVTLPPEIARQVDTMAKKRRLSDNRVLVELIEQGIEARKQREKAFFALTQRFRAEKDPEKVKRLGDELGRMVFGEYGHASAEALGIAEQGVDRFIHECRQEKRARGNASRTLQAQEHAGRRPTRELLKGQRPTIA